MKTVKIAIIVVCFLAASLVLIMQLGGGDQGRTRDITHFWFFDTQTKELFTWELDPNITPPVTAPSGGEGVKAHVYGCGGCDGGTWIGYLEKWSAEAKQHIESKGTDQNIMANGHMISNESAEQWHVYNSPEGQDILNAVYKKCSGAKAVKCYPSP